MNAADLTRFIGWVLWLSTGAYTALAVRLWMSGLFRRYPCFFGFIVFRTARSLILSLVPINSANYGDVWGATLPVLWVLYVLVVLELYGLVLESYKGLATVGRWALMIGLGLSVTIAALTLGAEFNPDGKYPLLRYWTIIDRGVQSSLVLFLLFITLFLAWYPVKLSRNVVVHCIVYATYFLSGACGILMWSFWRNSEIISSSVNLGLSATTLACLLAWIFLLKPSGEHVTVTKRPQWNAEDEAHLMSQLSAINASLLRAARK